MAAYAAVASLMNNIDRIMIHPRLSASFHKKQTQRLLQAAGLLLDFINGYSYGGVMSKEVEDFERRIARAAHADEDVIESLIVDQIRPESSQCIADLQPIIEDTDAILRSANELKEDEGSRVREEEQPRNSRIPLVEAGETAMVGFEDELIQIMDVLTNQQTGRHVVSIVGMGGMGKTTLARNLYHTLLIKQHFDVRAWATVSQQYNAKDIFSQLLSSLGRSFNGTVYELGEQLHKTLSGRRYLIILDDIWSVEAWDEVGRFFPDNGNGSRFVLTTRLSSVARDSFSSSCFTMKPLDEYKSWELFCRKAFEQENCPYPELEKLGKGIVRLCRGLPLSIVVIGRLLMKSPRSVEFWEEVGFTMKSSPGSKEKAESLDILSLSYDHLPSHLKPCFLYMGVFKEDSEIRVSKIINLWVAEGFLRPNNTQIIEEVGEEYLEELIDRNLVIVKKNRCNGKIGSCSIHDLLRELCLKVGEQQEFFHVSRCEVGGTERRLVCSHKSRLLQIGGPSLARSMLTGTTAEQPVNHKLLRVWDEGVLKSREEIYGNVNLHYLSYTLLHESKPEWKLPTSTSLLWNLQTLIIKQTTSRAVVVAPIEIWRMRQLRHVKVKASTIYVPDPPPMRDGSCMMDNLQTLTTAMNMRLSEKVCELIPNIKKLHIAYGRYWYGYDDCLFEFRCDLDCLHKLKSLKVSIRESIWRTPDPEVSKILRFPISLNKLTLYGCQLGSEYLQMIGSLPQLEVLQLRDNSFTERNEWSPFDEQFLRLKFLKIAYCGLTRFNADDSHFPVLKKLVLGHLWSLEEIPMAMGEITTLELISVDSCRESAVISAVKIKEDQLEMGNDALQIQVRLSADSKMESFKKRVKAEGLTVNHIQLEIDT